MNSITIITIVVVVLLAFLIVGLSLLAYHFCLKSYKLEISNGLHDDQISKEYNSKLQKKNKWSLLGLIGSWVALAALLSIFVTGIIYKANGQMFSVSNNVALVIKTGSMSDFYNEEVAEQNNNDRRLQFDVGDICFFNKVSSDSELTIGDVYGYRYKNKIITHRLVSVNDNLYRFRGDNNSAYDSYISRENIIYHYTGNKAKGIGSVVLYAQSYFGIFSLVGVIAVMVMSEVVYSKVDNMTKARAKELGFDVDKKKGKARNPKK